MFGGLSSPILRNKLPTCSLTVVYRRPDKVVCRSNSLCFFAAHAPTHVSLEMCTFRCLVGHVFQRSGPVDRNMCATMVNLSQVIISPNLICKIHIPGLTARWSSKAFLFFFNLFSESSKLQNCSKLHLSQTAFDVCALGFPISCREATY
jgi:hypothetical protein